MRLNVQGPAGLVRFEAERLGFAVSSREVYIIDGEPNDEEIHLAAALVARYGQGRDADRVEMTYRAPDGTTRTDYGRYDDAYVKQDGVWLFKSRAHSILYSG